MIMKLMLASLAWLPLAAQAHYLWLEPVGNEMRLYFGEYENALREKSGGRLDSISSPSAVSPIKAAIPLLRKDDHFLAQGLSPTPLTAQDTAMPVKDLRKNHIGIVKPMYYARFVGNGAEAPSTQALDIQPLGADRFRVTLHGKPLAKAKLLAYAPNQWMREYETDDVGEASVHTPWPGLYVLEVVQLEATPGTYQGEPYEAVRHVSTLSLVK